VNIVRQEHVPLPYLRQPACWTTLDNGHQIITIHKPGEVAHLHTVVRTGSVNETDANTGVSHFLEHLMFKGTERFPAGTFDRLLESIGARVNASTAKDLTQYFVTLPKGLDGVYYRLALDLHADMLLHAALPEEEIGPTFDPANPLVAEKRERMVVIEEIKMGHDNPWRQAVSTLAELIYPTHPYRREVIGTAEVIAAIPREDIVQYYRTWYQPANMVTIATGDLEAEPLLREIALSFDFHAVQPVLHPVFAPELPPQAPRSKQLTAPLNVAYVLLGYLGPASDDLRVTIALDVLSLTLGEGISSRLQLRLIEQLPDTPFFDAGSTHWTLRDNSNLLAYGIVRPDAALQARELLLEQVNKLHTEPPSATEFEKAITRLETSFAAQAETASGISYGIADSMARLNNPSGYTEYLPTLRSLTREDIAEAAATYLANERVCMVTVAP